MPYLHAGATGTLTAAATWRVVDATSLIDSVAGQTTLTTAFVSSSAFTPGAITIDGIAVKVAARNGTTGTMTVRLAQAGVAVAGTTVTVNVSDIPPTIGTPGTGFTGCSIGWFFLKFAAPVTLLAATAYTLQATTSNATQVTLFRDATAANYSRMLRTTTTQAPVAGDSMFVGGEWTAAATKTDRAVTIDPTAATDYGNASTTLASVGVSKGGTLLAGTTAGTTYIFRLSGILMNWSEGVVNLGTTSAPVPGSSSFLLEFDCAADGDFGVVNYGTWRDGGSPRTAGKLFVRTLLTADVAAAGASLTVADDTGWLNGDQIAIAPTVTATHGELATLNANAGASSLSLSAGVTNAHDGDAANEMQADVILITRNVRITTVSSSFYGYACHRGGSWESSWSEWNRIGTNTGGKHGFSLDIANVSATFTYCAFALVKADFAEFTVTGVTLTFTDCVTWRIGESTQGLLVVSTAGAPIVTATRLSMLGTGVITNCGIYVGGVAAAVRLDACRFSGLASIPLRIDSGVCYATDCDWTHCNDTNGLILNNASAHGSRFIRQRFFRCGGGGVVAAGSAEWIDCEFYGTAGRHDLSGRQRLVNCSYNSLAGYNMATAHRLSTGVEAECNGCTYGVVAGERTALTSFAIDTQSLLCSLTLVKCEFNGTQFNGTPPAGSVVAQQDQDGVVADHVTRRYGHGTLTIETGTFGDATPALKLTPEHAYRELRSPLFTKQINSGQSATFTAKVRKSAGYNGMAPRLVLVANSSIGVGTDTVLDTLSVAADVWETLTGAMSAAATQDGVVSVWVACDGTAGDVFVDDITVTVA